MTLLKCPVKILNKALEELEDISDEVGIAVLSETYILKYEGWSGECATALVEHKGLKWKDVETNIELIITEESDRIIFEEWIPQMKQAKYFLTEAYGYLEGRLYGVTWAVFKHMQTNEKRS